MGTELGGRLAGGEKKPAAAVAHSGLKQLVKYKRSHTHTHLSKLPQNKPFWWLSRLFPTVATLLTFSNFLNTSHQIDTVGVFLSSYSESLAGYQNIHHWYHNLSR